MYIYFIQICFSIPEKGWFKQMRKEGVWYANIGKNVIIVPPRASVSHIK